MRSVLEGGLTTLPHGVSRAPLPLREEMKILLQLALSGYQNGSNHSH